MESQMDEAQADRQRAANPPLSEKQKAMERERQSLILARADIVHRIESSSSERYRNQLRQTLEDLDAKIAKLSVHS